MHAPGDSRVLCRDAPRDSDKQHGKPGSSGGPRGIKAPPPQCHHLSAAALQPKPQLALPQKCLVVLVPLVTFYCDTGVTRPSYSEVILKPLSLLCSDACAAAPSQTCRVLGSLGHAFHAICVSRRPGLSCLGRGCVCWPGVPVGYPSREGWNPRPHCRSFAACPQHLIGLDAWKASWHV
jgi:hypothetical protein